MARLGLTDQDAQELAVRFAGSAHPEGSPDADPLTSIEALQLWLSDAGIVPVDATVPKSWPARRQLMAEAYRLRASVESLFSAVSRRRPVAEAVLYNLNRVLALAMRTSRLSGDEGAWTLEQHHDRSHPLASLFSIAEGAALVVTQTDARRLRRCAAKDCSAWFVDTSKGGRRRWCSMERCGNRSKAARYRARHGVSD